MSSSSFSCVAVCWRLCVCWMMNSITKEIDAAAVEKPSIQRPGKPKIVSRMANRKTTMATTAATPDREVTSPTQCRIRLTGR
jgi:hypothetical protein